MKLVKPFTVTSGALTSCSIAELSNGEVAYVAGTTYAQGATVAYNKRRYESLQNANTGHQPDLSASSSWWLDIGPTNKWAMFDLVNGTVSTAPASISFSIQTSGRISCVGLLNMTASAVNITAHDVNGNEVYNKSFVLRDFTVINGYYDYFFTDVPELNDVVAIDLPLYANMLITVTVTGTTVSIGTVAVGWGQDLGDTQYGVHLGILDYSRKDTDDFGNYILVERAFSNRGSFPVVVKGETVEQVAAKVANIRNTLAKYRATPVLWIGADQYSASFVFGIYRSFDLEVSLPLQSVLSVDLEGLT